ncbi:AAA family ATPase [Pseudosulfitobacter sp. DSM 107133]|uniref:AAA family ATPase n=1 Tax=Pseudosulfitobacter sp. DSM 107133 TaxID=2883100 RepID=UPI000DF26D75|nr:AAA family ATPase [Pseudosulfitobacter sp. DSM 107133]UOA27118.1 ATP-dependent zinc metalloprotease FtsH [Pseudosulfitobacter sp. DSM 107133]
MTQNFPSLPGFSAAKSHLLEHAQTVSDLFERISHVDDDVPGWPEPEGIPDDAPLLGPPAPAPLNGAHCLQALAILQLAKTFEDRALTAMMRDGRPVCLTLPDHDMGEIVETAAQALYPEAFAVGRSGKIWRAPEAATSGKTIIALAEVKLRSFLHEGHSVLMLTSSEQTASSQVQDLVGHDLNLAPISHEMILGVLTLTHTPTSPGVTDALVETLPTSTKLCRLTTLKLIMAFQADTAVEVAQRLSRFAAAAPQKAGPKLSDVFGQEEAVAAFMQLQEDLNSWQAGEVSWEEVTSSLLLYGLPGTGKTLLPTAFTNSAGLPLIKTSYADCQKAGHQGDMLRALDMAVNEAINSAPSVLFIDEIDAFYARSSEVHNSRYMIGVVTGLLTQIDRVNATAGVVLVGATNHLTIVDEAVVRAGRFDRHIAIAPLNLAAITSFLQAKLGDVVEARELRHIAARMIGATGAEIDDFIRKTRTLAREVKSNISDRILRRAADLYLPCPDTPLLRRIAAHEAGHLLVGHLLKMPRATLARVTSKGGAVLRDQRIMQTDKKLNDDIAMLLAGRAAEQLLCNSISNGAGCGIDSDLAKATRLALQAETQFGFAENIMLWHDIPHPPRPFDIPHDLASRATERLKAAEAKATTLLSDNQPALMKIADTLFEAREIEGRALDLLLEAATNMDAVKEPVFEGKDAPTTNEAPFSVQYPRDLQAHLILRKA